MDSKWKRCYAILQASGLRPIPLFWLAISVTVAWYLAYVQYPAAYNAATTTWVRLYFVARTGTDPKAEVIYWPNEPFYKERYGWSISNKLLLYYSACDLLPITERKFCDQSNNWKGVNIMVKGCANVSTCNIFRHGVSETEQQRDIGTLVTTEQGKDRAIPPISTQPHDMSNPINWGTAARFPLFILFVYFGIKLGILSRQLIFRSQRGVGSNGMYGDL